MPVPEQPPEGVTVTTNDDGKTQTIHATATLEAAVATGNEEENG